MDRKHIDETVFIRKLTTLALGGLNGLPQNPQARHVLLKSISIQFVKSKRYTETQVNQTIQAWLTAVCASGPDHVYLRRSLIDYVYLTRSADGTAYAIGDQQNVPFSFDAGIDRLDIKALIAEKKLALNCANNTI